MGLRDYQVLAREGASGEGALVAQLKRLDGASPEPRGVGRALELLGLFKLMDFLNLSRSKLLGTYHAGLLVLSLRLVIQSC